MVTEKVLHPIEENSSLSLPKLTGSRLGPAGLLFEHSINNVVLVGWGLWVLFSLTLFVHSNTGDDLLVSYFCYLVVGALGLWLSRRDLIAPTGAFVLVAFSGFGINIPLIAAGYIPFIHIDSLTLTKVTYVLLCAHGGFMLGALLPNIRINPIRAIIGTASSTRGTSVVGFVLLMLLLVAAAAVRKVLHLGEAGIQPSIPYAGVAQYFLYQGPLVMSVWFLAQGLAQKRSHALLGLSLLVCLAVTQALLGWRGGILYVLIIAAVPFWYQFKRNETQKHYSMSWLMILVVLSSSIIQLGSVVRTERLGGESAFSKGNEEFIEKILVRAQGTTRLAEVTNYFGQLSFTNGFVIEKLWSRNLSATTYIDREVYGVKPTQSHSVGTSGPGGPYTACGLMGVLGSYCLLGIFYRLSYFAMTDYETSSINILGIVWYAFLMFMLFEVLNENFGINALKMYFAVLVQIYMLKLVLKKRGASSWAV